MRPKHLPHWVISLTLPISGVPLMTSCTDDDKAGQMSEFDEGDGDTEGSDQMSEGDGDEEMTPKKKKKVKKKKKKKKKVKSMKKKKMKKKAAPAGDGG